MSCLKRMKISGMDMVIRGWVFRCKGILVFGWVLRLDWGFGWVGYREKL